MQKKSDFFCFGVGNFLINFSCEKKNNEIVISRVRMLILLLILFNFRKYMLIHLKKVANIEKTLKINVAAIACGSNFANLWSKYQY